MFDGWYTVFTQAEADRETKMNTFTVKDNGPQEFKVWENVKTGMKVHGGERINISQRASGLWIVGDQCGVLEDFRTIMRSEAYEKYAEYCKIAAEES